MQYNKDTLREKDKRKEVLIMGYAKIFRNYTGLDRKFSSFCIGELFMSDDDVFIKIADDKALNLSRIETMLPDDALVTIDNDDNFPCQDEDFIIKTV